MSFARFHERGFNTPAHKFLRGLLNYYKVELQHLTPNGVQHIAVFVALCEGFLGISPHFDLWRASLCRQSSEEVGREARAERAGGMCRHSSPQQQGE